MRSKPRNPYFVAVFAHCAAKPGAVEGRPWREIVFRVDGRVFAFLGRPDRAHVTLKPDAERQEPLLRSPAVRRARYVAWLGWVTVSIDDDKALALALELVDESYRAAARRGS